MAASALSGAAAPREQAALDAEFTLDTIADLESLFTRRAKAAADAASRFAYLSGVPYGAAKGETLNLFPARAARAPVQIFIHGGFWSSMEAAQFSFLAPGFVPFGAALIVIDYPLIPDVRMEDIVRSCRRALAWTWEHGPAHGIDRERIHVSGNSAGGHLVAELMDRAWLDAANLPGDVIKGGAAISGLYDLAPVAASFRNELLQFSTQDVARFSPLRRRIDIAAPMILAVGGNETGEFLAQSQAFAAHCRAAGSPVAHMIVPGANHITVVVDAFADPQAQLNLAVRRQMGLER